MEVTLSTKSLHVSLHTSHSMHNILNNDGYNKYHNYSDTEICTAVTLSLNHVTPPPSHDHPPLYTDLKPFLLLCRRFTPSSCTRHVWVQTNVYRNNFIRSLFELCICTERLLLCNTGIEFVEKNRFFENSYLRSSI